jgi:hypothetical protein
MRSKLFTSIPLTLAIAGGLLRNVPSARAQGAPAEAQTQRLKALEAAGPKASLTLLPVRVLGQPNRDVADVLGLALEKHGMENLDVADTPFVPTEGGAWEQTPARIAEFLKQNPPKSAYALYAEFLGDPKNGPSEVHWLVTDAAGSLVLSDRQTPADADFRRVASRDPDPMGCSRLVAERLFAQLRWTTSPVASRPEGKFARLWAEKAGAPNQAERSAMKERSDKLSANLNSARIGVYATRVNQNTDTDSAERLARLVAQQLGCRANSIGKTVSIEIKPSSNQQKRLWDLARGFRAHLRSDPPETDYALLAEYLFDPASGAVHAVNFVVCEKSGDWVIVDFQNDQHDDFRRMAPNSVENCDRLTAECMARRLR